MYVHILACIFMNVELINHPVQDLVCFVLVQRTHRVQCRSSIVCSRSVEFIIELILNPFWKHCYQMRTEYFTLSIESHIEFKLSSDL